jgi:chromosome segregation ATPase
MGVVEFDGAVDGLRIDSRLVKGGAETPAAYVAIGGGALATGLGYALVQLPYAAAATAGRGDSDGRPVDRVDDDVTERRYRTRVDEAEARVTDLRRKLEDAATESEAAMRVARAQGDEIEELRGRLRRAAEDRAALDAEMAKLRRALADADESVLSLTRRTAEEMAAVAERMAVGLRAPVVGSSAELTAARDEAARLRVKLAETETRAAAAEQRLEELGATTRERQTGLEDALERLRLSESELARARRDMIRLEQTARAQAEGSGRGVDTAPLERALAARDERIARLEAEKQELVWRIAELEDKLRAAIARALRAESGAPVAPTTTPSAPSAPVDSAAAQGSRERVSEEYHRAAAAHVQEITELKAALAEQAALVAELEDAVRTAEGRGTAAETEATTLRRTAKDLSDADRSRRSRLAELEGKLLRLEHERRQASANAAAAQPAPVPTGADPEELARVRAARDELVRRGEEDRVAWTREREALRAEVASLNARVGANGHHAAADEAAQQPAPAANDAGDAGRLESTLGNYRQRAGRLRDDLEGIRRRLDSLTSSEIAGFLEELGDDLAELEK